MNIVRDLIHYQGLPSGRKLDVVSEVSMKMAFGDPETSMDVLDSVNPTDAIGWLGPLQYTACYSDHAGT